MLTLEMVMQKRAKDAKKQAGGEIPADVGDSGTSQVTIKLVSDDILHFQPAKGLPMVFNRKK